MEVWTHRFTSAFADLTDAILNGVNLSGARLRGARLTRAQFTNVNLNDADLSETTLPDLHTMSHIHWTERTRWGGQRQQVQERSIEVADGYILNPRKKEHRTAAAQSPLPVPH